MSNELYDYLRENAHWVGRDCTSQAKFVIFVSEKFGIRAGEAEAAIAKVLAMGGRSPDEGEGRVDVAQA